MSCSTRILSVAARGSALSKVQVKEVLEELHIFHPDVAFKPLWVQTEGDRDLTTSLRNLEKTSFFTQEIDALQLEKKCRLSIHSAKDLPEPLAKGLAVVALTKGVDPSDSLVFAEHKTLQDLPLGAKVGTSSLRREKNIQDLREDLLCVDIRGTIEARLSLLDQGTIDALVVAEAALIRLNLTHLSRMHLSGERSALQGQLAVIALEDDEEMFQLFECIDGRRK